MRISYIILAHKNPEQLERLIRALRHPGVCFYIHIDKKTKISPFQKLLPPDKYQDVFFIKKRTDIRWGQFSMVQATIDSLEETVNNRQVPNPDYIFLLSGQDYPVASNTSFFDFVEKNSGKEFICCAKFPSPFWPPDGGYSRIKKYYFADLLKWYYPQKALHLFMPDRKFPKGLHPYGGSMWWGLSADCVAYILQFIKKRPDYTDFFKNAAVSDEIFFHTIIMNSKFCNSVYDVLENGILKNSTRFIRWGKKRAPHPETLRQNDYEEIIGSGKLLARKFDIYKDNQILDMLDAYRKIEGA